MLNTGKADVYTDFDGLAQLKTQARNESPEALQQVAKQFEAIFLNMTLKSMRSAKLADGILDSSQSKFFQDMYDQQLALHLSADPGIGLADLIVRQLSPESELTGNTQQALGDYRKQAVVTVFSTANDKSASIEKQQPIAQKPERDLKVQTDPPITSANQFINQLSAYAEQAAEQLGVQPGVLIAQAALETGWGKAVITKPDGSSSHNLFNIKADKSWQGDQAKVATLEYDQGVAKKDVAGFRVYNSFKESFQDYVNFIKSNPRYSEALKQVRNPQRYMHELQKAGYATDPRYADKVLKIFYSNLSAAASSQQLVLNEQ